MSVSSVFEKIKDVDLEIDRLKAKSWELQKEVRQETKRQLVEFLDSVDWWNIDIDDLQEVYKAIEGESFKPK